MYIRKKGDIIYVVWLDPETDGGWIDDHLPELEPVVTVGIFLKESDTTLWMSSTFHGGTEDFADRMTFPKGCILNVGTIKTPKEISKLMIARQKGKGQEKLS